MKTFKTKAGTELPIMDIKGKDYLQVAHRLIWFREEHDSDIIKTEIVAQGPDWVVFKATIGNNWATAHKREDAKGFPDYIEKAETGAIGRALALCGYGTQFCAGELDEGERLADAPLPPKTASQANGVINGAHPIQPMNTRGPSEAQIKRLFGIAKASNWQRSDIMSFISSNFQKSYIEDLTLREYDFICDSMPAGSAPKVVESKKVTKLTEEQERKLMTEEDLPF